MAETNGHDVVDKEVILRQGNYIFIKRNFLFVKLKLSEILFLEADGNYVPIGKSYKESFFRQLGFR